MHTAKRKVEELQRIRQTHLKQLQIFANNQKEMAKEKEAMQTKYNVAKNGLFPHHDGQLIFYVL